MKSVMHELAFAIWAFRPEAAEAWLPQVHRIMSGEQAITSAPTRKELELMEEAGLMFVTADGRELKVGPSHQPIQAEAGMVAVLNIEGPIMKNTWCGVSTTVMANWMRSFEASEEIAGVVINMDSPGGNGYGMLTLTSQIEAMRKPVVSIVQHGMACSAGYGICASGDLVFAKNDVDEFGSIGTYVRIPDWSGMYEKAGVKIHTIRATRSSEKNRMFEEAMKADPKDPNDPNYKALRENYIDPFNEHFIELVQRNRPGVKDADGVLAGRVFMAQDAMKHALIDSTGETLESAIAAVRKLAA